MRCTRPGPSARRSRRPSSSGPAWWSGGVGCCSGCSAPASGSSRIVAIFPLLRSLGPLPGLTLTKTNWRRGSLLVDASGRAVHKDDLAPGGLVTVFPAGYEKNDQTLAVDQTVLIRAQTTALVTEPGRASWAPDGYVAYSKLCTHSGLPGRPLRAGAAPPRVPLPPVDVPHRRRRGAGVRAGAAPVAPAAPLHRQLGVPARPGRLRPAGRPGVL